LHPSLPEIAPPGPKTAVMLVPGTSATGVPALTMDSSIQDPTIGDPGGMVGAAVVETGAGVTGVVVQPAATSARRIIPKRII
jgi:hypothetical protein